MTKGWITDQEAAKLIRSFLNSRGERGASEEELEGLVEWANEQRIGALLVDMVLEGEVRIADFADGEPLLYRVPAVTS